MFADLLKGHRKHLHLTQAELAKRSGISRTHIASMETGKRGPNAEDLHRLTVALRLERGEQQTFEDAGHSARAEQDSDLSRYVEQLERRLNKADDRLRTHILLLTRIRDAFARKGIQLPQDILDAISSLEQDASSPSSADDPIRRPG